MSSQDPAAPWYARSGVRFECTGCSACCKRDGMVEFTPQDIARISAHRGETPEVFEALYLEPAVGALVVTVSAAQPCVFLGDQGQCTIHEVKPIQCASYPFWPELLESGEAWTQEAQACEGIGRGPRIDEAEIARRTLPGDDGAHAPPTFSVPATETKG